MATSCDLCGYKSNEVKSGGAISLKGKRISIKMETVEDLSRDILKSETCGMSIPDIDLILEPGTMGGKFTTIEGLVNQLYNELEGRSKQFSTGDSATKEQKQKWNTFLEKLKDVFKINFVVFGNETTIYFNFG